MNPAPLRVQRSRQRKQVSPNGLPIVYVGRGSKYGNPFKLGDKATTEWLNIFDDKDIDAYLGKILIREDCLYLYEKCLLQCQNLRNAIRAKILAAGVKFRILAMLTCF